MSKQVQTLWGSRFDTKPDQAAVAFAAGYDVSGMPPADAKLLPFDIWLNRAHCVMLHKQNIISREDAQVILKGLSEIREMVEKGVFELDPEKEDVHTNIESWLIEKYGIESCGKLHTARSRNDQVVTDMRLYLRDQTLFFIEELVKLVIVLQKNAQTYQSAVMPGFTHHQHAMITTFGHMLASFASMFLRDIEKLKYTYKIINTNPLGSAASYGTSFDIDRTLTTHYLGFTEADINSMDAITNRGEPEADLAYCLSSTMNHLSMLAETLIVFSTPQFLFVEISDKYSTGSSIMPQKKNPDTLEVIKGKTSLVHGALASLLSSTKGAYIGYNRDSQWTKYIIMNIVENCSYAPSVMAGIIDELTVHAEKMAEWSNKGYIGATSFLELLCQQHNLPFRKGKIIVEKAIKYSQDNDVIDKQGLQKSLAEEKVDITIDDATLAKWQNPREILNLYVSSGSPGLSAMRESLKIIGEKINKDEVWLEGEKNKLVASVELLNNEIKKIL